MRISMLSANLLSSDTLQGSKTSHIKMCRNGTHRKEIFMIQYSQTLYKPNHYRLLTLKDSVKLLTSRN